MYDDTEYVIVSLLNAGTHHVCMLYASLQVWVSDFKKRTLACLIENTQDVSNQGPFSPIISIKLSRDYWRDLSDNCHSLTLQSSAMSWESWMRQDTIPAGSHSNLSLTLCSQSREEFIRASAETYHSLTHHWGFGIPALSSLSLICFSFQLDSSSILSLFSP